MDPPRALGNSTAVLGRPCDSRGQAPPAVTWRADAGWISEGKPQGLGGQLALHPSSSLRAPRTLSRNAGRPSPVLPCAGTCRPAEVRPQGVERLGVERAQLRPGRWEGQAASVEQSRGRRSCLPAPGRIQELRLSATLRDAELGQVRSAPNLTASPVLPLTRSRS